MTCHIPGGAPGLDDTALTPIVGLDAIADGRRQPSQPPPRLFGSIPSELIDNSALAGVVPPTSSVAPAGGSLIDGWMQPSYSQVAVRSFTLIDVTNNLEVVQIRSNNLTEVTRKANTTYAVRVNLDSAQGQLNIQHTPPLPNTTITSGNTSFPYVLAIPGTVNLGEHTIMSNPSELGSTITVKFKFK